MPPQNDCRLRAGTGPSPEKNSISRGKKQRSAKDAEDSKEEHVDTSLSRTSDMLRLMEENYRSRDSFAPSPPSISTSSSSRPTSPTKRRIESGALPPSPKKSKSDSNGTSITDDMGDLYMQESSNTSVPITNRDDACESRIQTPRPESTTTFNFADQACSSEDEYSCEPNAGLPLNNDMIPSVEYIENADFPINNPLEVDENTISQTQFEVFDSLEKRAESVVTCQAEDFFSRAFNAKTASELARIEELKKQFIKMAQFYNERIASDGAEIAQLRERVERHCEIHEETIASGRAKMAQIREGIELLQMKPSLSQVEVLNKEWELAMLQHRKRDLIRVGRDGNDEFFKAPFSEQCYVDLAREILRRCRPEDGPFHGCYPNGNNSKPELMSDFNLNFLSLLSRGPDPKDAEAFEAAAWFISRSLLVDREETYRCLAAHPYYQQLNQIQSEIKQELIWFFDRRFTYQMGQFYGINIRLDDILLRLGGGGAFHEEDSLNCGGLDEMMIGADNKDAWAYLLAQNLGIDEPSIERQSTSFSKPPIPDRLSNTSELSDKAPSKRNRPVTESEAEQYRVVRMQASTPGTTVKRADRVTESEMMEYKILAKKSFGEEALELKSTVVEDPERFNYKSNGKEENLGRVSSSIISRKDESGQGTSMVREEIMGMKEMGDVTLA